MLVLGQPSLQVVGALTFPLARLFLARLGKRMQQTTDQSNVDMEKVLCAYYGIDCKRFKKVPAKRSWSSLRSPLFARGTYNNNNYDDYDDYNNNDIRQPDSNLVDKTYNNNNNLEQFEDSDALSMLDNPFEPRAK